MTKFHQKDFFIIQLQVSLSLGNQMISALNQNIHHYKFMKITKIKIFQTLLWRVSRYVQQRLLSRKYDTFYICLIIQLWQQRGLLVQQTKLCTSFETLPSFVSFTQLLNENEIMRGHIMVIKLNSVQMLSNFVLDKAVTKFRTFLFCAGFSRL